MKSYSYKTDSIEFELSTELETLSRKYGLGYDPKSFVALGNLETFMWKLKMRYDRGR